MLRKHSSNVCLSCYHPQDPAQRWHILYAQRYVQQKKEWIWNSSELCSDKWGKPIQMARACSSSSWEYSKGGKKGYTWMAFDVAVKMLLGMPTSNIGVPGSTWLRVLILQISTSYCCSHREAQVMAQVVGSPTPIRIECPAPSFPATAHIWGVN